MGRARVPGHGFGGKYSVLKVLGSFSFRAITLFVAPLFVSCASSGTQVESTIDRDAPPRFSGTHMFVSPCHTKLSARVGVESVVGDIAAALASGVIKTGLNLIGSSLNEAAQDDIDSTLVSSNLNSFQQLAPPNSNYPICLFVVRGEFQETEKTSGEILGNPFAANHTHYTPGFVEIVPGTKELFAEFLPVVHESAVSFVPLQLQYSGYTPSDKRRGKPRDLSFFIGYAPPNQDVAQGNYSGRLVNFGTLYPGKSELASVRYTDSAGRIYSVANTQWIPLPEAGFDVPITLAAKVIETREAGQMAKFLAEAFTASKTEIETAVLAAAAELDIFESKEELRQAQLDQEQAMLDKAKVFYESEAAAIAALDDYIELCDENNPAPSAEDVYNASYKLLVARRKANIDAKAAGIEIPFRSEQLLDPSSECVDPDAGPASPNVARDPNQPFDGLLF